MSRYEKWYLGIYEYIITRGLSEKLVNFKKILTSIVVLSYIVLLIYCAIGRKECILKVILVPLMTFLLVSLIRSLIDADRPYAKYNIEPIIDKDISGKSFPSRHTFSACIIAMAWIYVYMPVGILLMVITFLMALIRVFLGVHFPKDVMTAIFVGVLFGIIGFWII